MRVPDPAFQDPDKAGSRKAGSGTSIRDLIFDLRPDLRHVFGSAADFYLHKFFAWPGSGFYLLSDFYVICGSKRPAASLPRIPLA